MCVYFCDWRGIEFETKQAGRNTLTAASLSSCPSVWGMQQSLRATAEISIPRFQGDICERNFKIRLFEHCAFWNISRNWDIWLLTVTKKKKNLNSSPQRVPAKPLDKQPSGHSWHATCQGQEISRDCSCNSSTLVLKILHALPPAVFLHLPRPELLHTGRHTGLSDTSELTQRKFCACTSSLPGLNVSHACEWETHPPPQQQN